MEFELEALEVLQDEQGLTGGGGGGVCVLATAHWMI
jgi:hypothetical protein